VDLKARIAELESELAEANEEIARLREVEAENAALKDQVHDLHSELVTLSPPKIPDFSDAPEDARNTGQASRSRKSQLKTWMTLLLVLAGALIAALPYLLDYLSSEHRAGGEFTRDRGVISGD